ncbi:MAG: hypothetical protein HPY44_03505 [Armatimonadetes bacterium]|nr:hypothetical protein [Armatimonadota bacterium]
MNATLDPLRAKLTTHFDRAGKITLVVVALAFLWVASLRLLIAWLLQRQWGGDIPGGVVAAVLVIVAVVFLLPFLMLSGMTNDLRRIAREHVGTSDDSFLARSGPRGLRWIAVGPGGVSLAGVSDAFTIPPAQLRRLLVHGRRFWLEWEDRDGITCAVWSERAVKAPVLEALQTLVRMHGGEVVTVEGKALSGAMNRGRSRIQRATRARIAPPLMALVGVLVPTLIIEDLFRGLQETDPEAYLNAILAMTAAATALFALVWFYYAFPAFTQAERAAWAVPGAFQDA